MDEYQEMKKFIDAAASYMRIKSDKCASDLQTHLQIISSANDLLIFHPDTPIAPLFYVSLHELMSNLDPLSPLVWPTLSVLQKSCANDKAREGLIHTFKFIPVLSRFLSVSDKQHRVLQILQELTYGVSITWQEAHLPQLVTTLSQILMGKNKDHKPQALHVLVNLCYKNTPVLYVLTRKVDIKTLVRYITKMNETPLVRMLVCKMLIILSELKGPLPEADILHFIDVSFSCISDAFQQQDLSTLQQMTDFFNDMVNDVKFYGIMQKYPRIVEDVKRLVDIMDCNDKTGPFEECISVLLNFIKAAFKIKISKTIKLTPKLLSAAIPWISNDKTCIAAFHLINAITESCFQENENIPQELLCFYKTLTTAGGAFLSCDSEQLLNNDYKEKLSVILSLLSDMVEIPNLRNLVLNSINPEDIKNMLEEVNNQNEFLEQSLKQNSEVCHLLIHLIFFVSSLSKDNSEWLNLYNDLLCAPSIMRSLSIIIIKGSKDIKYKALKLLGNNSWDDKSLKALCAMMTEVKPDIVKENMTTKTPATQETMPPLLSVNRIDELLDKLQQGSITDARTSEVMELYEYKLVAMAQNERRLQSTLEAADAHCSGLNHQIALLKSEVNQLHQTLFCVQQTVEGTSIERNDLINQITRLNAEVAHEKTANAQKIKQLTKQSLELENTTVKLQEELSKNEHLVYVMEAKTVECDELNSKLLETRSKCEDLIKLKVLTEESLEKARSDIAECQMQIADLKSENEDLKKKIQYLEKIREAVISVAAKRDDF